MACGPAGAKRMGMRPRFLNSRRQLAALALAATIAWAGPALAHNNQSGRNQTPSQQEILALVDRVIAHQHHNDDAIELYERKEHRIVRKHEENATPSEDKVFRVVPTGTGVVRVTLQDGGRLVDEQTYRKQLGGVEQALLNSLNPNLPRQKQDIEKFAKRKRERRELVDAVRDAFLFTWLGCETRDGRVLVKLQLDPNPDFKPTSRHTSLFAHVRATVWVDEAAAQVARVKAEIISDISFGGGILGKVYRGGRFEMEQVEVAPGVWLPTRYEYDFAGRKFLFQFQEHESTEASHYHRVGPPKDALATIRNELANDHTGWLADP